MASVNVFKEADFAILGKALTKWFSAQYISLIASVNNFSHPSPLLENDASAAISRTEGYLESLAFTAVFTDDCFENAAGVFIAGFAVDFLGLTILAIRKFIIY